MVYQEELAWWWGAFGALLGAALGSWLTVCVARIPRGMDIIATGSRCPHCATPIAAMWNVPIIGWLALRGTSACCKERISVRYPLFELAGALTLGVIAFHAALVAAALAATVIVVPVAVSLATRPHRKRKASDR